MSLIDRVVVNSHYTRSINLTRDADSTAVMESYIPTSRALKTLEQISGALLQEEAPRAWSLIGPYGSGKSSFAVFLSHLLNNEKSPVSKAAYQVLAKSSNKLSSEYESLVKDNSGYCIILLTGSPDSLSKSFVSALSRSANSIWETRKGKKPEIVKILSHYATQEEAPKVSKILDAIQDLQNALDRIGYKGILIAIDELGKFLEYEARHYGANDIFLLQSLAELAFAKHSVKLALVVMLHQSIEQYARGLGETLKAEWSKVQGRFESIPFLDTSEQTLRIVAAAINKELTKKEEKLVTEKISKQVGILIENNALPSTLDQVSAEELFYNCYPLHPLSALLLPILCQKVAQNERTLFSYLGSKEAHGFVDSLSKCENSGDQIKPWEIYEYFIRNQPITTSDHFTHRRWAEVVTAVERLGDAEFESIQTLKTIGLLNIIGGQGGLKASSSLLKICSSSQKSFNKSIKDLQTNSIIQFRKFNSEYRVWQGSDFDIETRAEEARDKLGNFSLAEKLNERHEILPIVARKYSIENGTLRYFEPIFSSREEYKKLKPRSRQPRVIFYLAESDDDKQFFSNEALNYFESDDIFVLCPNGEQIREVLADVLALEQVASTSQELTSDPVAQREYKDRYENSLEHELSLISAIMDSPDLNQWYWRHKEIKVPNKRHLQQVLSEILEKIYFSAPVIKNELINRNKTSSQANAARNKLIAALLSNLDKEDLGIAKFPAEKSIYRSLFKATGLHCKTKSGKWALTKASELDKNNKFYPVWKRIERFLIDTKSGAKSLIELNEELYSAPFGIKEGVLPLLYISAILTYQEKLAVTEDNTYVPYLTQDHLDRFLKRPDAFKIQYVDLGGVNGQLIQEYSSVWKKGNKPDTILKIAREIAKLIDGLPLYTQQTKLALSQHARAIISVFKLSKSPVKLLLEDIPRVLEIDASEGDASGLHDKLRAALINMQNCFGDMKKEMLSQIALSFDIPKDSLLSVVRKSVSISCTGLEHYTIDENGQKGFVLRVQRSKMDDDSWFDNLLMFLVSKPAQKWTDSDRVSAEYKLGTLISNIRELEKLRTSYEGVSANTSGDTDVYMLNNIKVNSKTTNNRTSEVIVVDQKLKESIKDYKNGILDIIKNSALDKKSRLALLAEVVDEYFDEQSSKKKINKLKNIETKENSNDVA